MLEIVHSLAPGAELYFATAFRWVASFAQNIGISGGRLQIIIDDVTYYEESPFQDGLISQAVNDVSAAGALFFLRREFRECRPGTSSTWEGDFKSAGDATVGRGGVLHDFGEGATANAIAAFRTRNNRVDLFGRTHGASANDYDLYIIDLADNVIGDATNTQDGQGTPYENVWATL
jgi:hypothetical protein